MTDHLTGVSSYRRVRLARNIVLYCFGDRHDFLVPITDKEYHFHIALYRFLERNQEVPIDIFTEYEYVSLSKPKRQRILDSDQRPFQPMMQLFYSCFLNRLQVKKQIGPHHFHYCDVRCRSTSMGVAASYLEELNICLDLIFDYRVQLAVNATRLHEWIRSVIRLQKSPRKVLQTYKIQKQIDKWENPSRKKKFLRWFHRQFQMVVLDPHELHALFFMMCTNKYRFFSPPSDLYGTIHQKIKSFCNLLVDAYTIGRVLNPNTTSQIRVLYMGEDHVVEICDTLLSLLPESVLEHVETDLHTCALQTGHELFRTSHLSTQTG